MTSRSARRRSSWRWGAPLALGAALVVAGCTTDDGADPSGTAVTAVDVEDELRPVPALAVPIADAGTAVVALVRAVEPAFDPEAPDWGLPAAWREIAPGVVFAGAATTADEETISGVEVVLSGDGEEVMAVAVADEEGRCAAFAIVAERDAGDDGEAVVVGYRVERGVTPEPCSGEALLVDRERDAGDESSAGPAFAPGPAAP